MKGISFTIFSYYRNSNLNRSNMTPSEILAETRRNMQNRSQQQLPQYTGPSVLDPNLWRYDNTSSQSSRNVFEQTRVDSNRYYNSKLRCLIICLYRNDASSTPSMWSNINYPRRRTPTAANIPSADIWSQSNTRQQTPNYDVSLHLS